MRYLMNRRELRAALAWTAALADRMKNAFYCAIVAIGALAFPGNAEAATLTTIQTIENIPFAFSRSNFPILEDVDSNGNASRSTSQGENINGQFQGFDPGLGTLQKVNINVGIDGRIELIIESSSIYSIFGGGGTREVVANLEFLSTNTFNGAAPSGLYRLFSTSYTVESSDDGGKGTVTDGDSALILHFLNGESVGQSFDGSTGDLSRFESASYLPFLLEPIVVFQLAADCSPTIPVSVVTACEAEARFRLEGNYDIRVAYTYDDLKDPSVVPLPAGLPLLGSALIGLAGLRRLRKRG